MNKIFEAFLPNPDDKATSGLSPETVLDNLKETIDTRYNGRIIGVPVSTAITNSSGAEVLNYSFFLQFSNHNGYVYRLFEAECTNNDGSYPLKVQSHYGPPIEYGIVDDQVSFEEKIKKILSEERTRKVILSMY